jgi:hypothetical protein
MTATYSRHAPAHILRDDEGRDTRATGSWVDGATVHVLHGAIFEARRSSFALRRRGPGFAGYRMRLARIDKRCAIKALAELRRRGLRPPPCLPRRFS